MRPRIGLRLWLLAGLLACVAGCLRPKLQRPTKPALAKAAPCPTRPAHRLRGWIDQMGDLCVAMIDDKERLFYVHRDSLPVQVKEGDYVRGGKILKQKRENNLAQVKAWIQQRPPLPRHFRVPGPRPPPKRRKSTYKRGSWRHWHHKRKKREQARERRRFSHNPWRLLWRKPRDPWR